MSKSVYSLVLSDEVVEAIDQLAYSMNTSRSNLINQILAEHVSMSTPEKKMRDIFQSLQNLMDETFQIQDLASDSMMSIRSPLRYKYKPTIRYGLELYPHSTAAMGRLKISFRTQNTQLIQALNGFFQIWIVLENHYIGKYFPQGISYTKENERYVRELNYPANLESCSSEDAGESIGTYIKMLDDMIKLYFSNIDLASEQLTAVLESRYRQYLSIPRFPII